MLAALDTAWDIVDVYSDVRDCFGDSDSMACAMLPVDALAVVALFAEGPSNNVARKTARAADAGEGAASSRSVLALRQGQGFNWVEVPTVDDYLSELGGRKVYSLDPENAHFYSVQNRGGGRVWVSTYEDIKPGHFENLVREYEGKVTILSGVHGDYFGDIQRATRFYGFDYQYWRGTPNVEVLHVPTLSPAQFKEAINRPGRVIAAWCMSERSSLVIDALRHP